MTNRERATKLCELLVHGNYIDLLEQALNEAEARGRKAGLEEAVHILEKERSGVLEALDHVQSILTTLAKRSPLGSKSDG